MQVVDTNGNIFGTGLEVTGPDGKPKTISGGGGPTGPAGGDLSGTYPNPSVVWNNGTSTYGLLYYPLSTNPSGFITASALTPYLTTALAASTYYPIPTGTVSQYIRGDGTLATFPTIPSITPAALTKTDDTNVTLTLGGTPATALLQSTSLTLGWTGTLADSRITSATTWNNKVTSLSSGTGISIGGTTTVPIVTNTAPDQTVSLSNGAGISVTGTYPSFTIASTITQYTDALARLAISLTTTGTSGAATYNSTTGVLNIPQYSSGGGGVTAVTATTPVVATGTTTPVISLASNYGDTQNPYGSKTSNHILAAPNGTAGVPTFRTIVAADIPTLNQNTTGTAANVTGIVALANGGTGTATPSLVAGTNVTITGTFPNQTIAASGSAGAVTQIVAGTNVTISPVGGTGIVTINSSGGGGGTIIKLTAQTLTSTSWILVSGFYTYTFTNVNITVNTRVDFTPNNTAYLEVTTCGMQTQVTVAAGSCIFYSLFPPQTNITGEITIFPT